MYRLRISLLFLLFLGTLPAMAQSQRSLLNDGLDQYNEKKYADSEVSFKKSLEKPGELNFHSNYNLGDALYKQGRYDEAAQYFQNSLQYAKDDKELSAKAFYNIGNSLAKKEKYKEAVEAYKNSLKLNPKDTEAKYNLSYALEKLKQQQNQQNKNDQNKDKNKDQNKDQQKNQDKNNQDKNKDQNKKDQNDKNKQDKQDQQNQQPQPKKNEISKEQADQILNAFKNNEADLQKNLRKKKGAVIKTDKDW
ncbi:MAG TPA: tetratricopeptide repeat protein [Ignavibacteriales bacterium]|nr:tetratricopeptide repeat protein [Ignavibacteriales bacterium]